MSDLRSLQIMRIKEENRLFESKRELAGIEEKSNQIIQKRKKYENAAEGLSRSARSVSPTKGLYVGESLIERSSWKEKAHSLRSYSELQVNQSNRELEEIKPVKEDVMRKLSQAEKGNENIASALSRYKLRQTVKQDEIENSELTDLRVFIRGNN